jgi:hypothetical protein
LKCIRAENVVANICIFGHHPGFLLSLGASALAELRMAEMHKFQEGLDRLDHLFFDQQRRH